MNIIIINGSPRKNGATANILKSFNSYLSKYENINIEYINLSDFNIQQCKGCCSCYKTGKCFIRDDAEMLVEKIENSDGIIIGSPTYASNISGLLKTFIDRGHFVIEQLLKGNFAISVATFENYGGTDTSKILNKLLAYSGASLSGKIVTKIPFNSDISDNKKLSDNIKKLSKKLYNNILKDKKYKLQNLKQNIIFNFGIKPFVVKKGILYNGVILKWKKYDV